MSFLRTKWGLFTLALALCMMAFAFYSVQKKRKARAAANQAPIVQVEQAPAPVAAAGGTAVKPGAVAPVPPTASRSTQQAKLVQASAMDGYHRNQERSQASTNPSGVSVTRRDMAQRPSGAGTEQVDENANREPVLQVPKVRLRLTGQSPESAGMVKKGKVVEDPAPQAAPEKAAVAKPTRFVPFGRPIKCELVFTIDSTMEQTPFVGLIMEPVYNNGRLVIPAGAELHGMARPDRTRDRIFSSSEWVLIFPREGGKPNGRQLKVKGLALDRVEPDVNGMTWGITDGSYGLQGTVIRTNGADEIKQFAATALAAVTTSLQEKQTNAFGQETTKSTPRNAAMQGLGASLDLMVKKIQEEISRNGVFIRVAGGHQFYFYPQQVIDPDRADIPEDFATVQ